jgi:hypothetical protein
MASSEPRADRSGHHHRHSEDHEDDYPQRKEVADALQHEKGGELAEDERDRPAPGRFLAR